MNVIPPNAGRYANHSSLPWPVARDGPDVVFLTRLDLSKPVQQCLLHLLGMRGGGVYGIHIEGHWASPVNPQSAQVAKAEFGSSGL